MIFYQATVNVSIGRDKHTSFTAPFTLMVIGLSAGSRDQPRWQFCTAGIGTGQ